MRRILIGLSCLAGFLVLVGCGHSDEEMAAKQAEVDRAQGLVAEATREVEKEKREVARQEAALEELKAGVLHDLQTQESESANNASSSAETRMNAKKDACGCK